MKRKATDFITVVEKVEAGSHPISVVRKKLKIEKQLPSQERFYKKKEYCETNAAIEVFAQEMMRMLSPAQPKTRKVDDHYVLSKAVEGYMSFDTLGLVEAKKRILAQSITGLGQILVGALLLNEVDLKPADIGINKQGKVLKLDGGLCFADACYGFSAGAIGAADLRVLPNLKEYQPHNWIGVINYVGSGVPRKLADAVFIDVCLQEAPFFRREVDQGILRGLLLSGESKIADFWVLNKDTKAELLNALEGRKLQLKKAAFENGYFIEYLLSDKAESDAAEYLTYLQDFTIKGKEKLMDEALVVQYNHTFKDLKALAELQHQDRMKKYAASLQVSLGIDFEEQLTLEAFQKAIALFSERELCEQYKILNALVVYGYQHGFVVECKRLVVDLFVNTINVIPKTEVPQIEAAKTAYALLDILERALLVMVRHNADCKHALTSPIDRSGMGIQNPLILAVMQNNLISAQVCLNAGWAVNSRWYDTKKTPIFYAAIKQNVKMMDWLIQKGADLYLQDAEGRKPLDEIMLTHPVVLDFLMGRQLTLESALMSRCGGIIGELVALAKVRNDARLADDGLTEILLPPTTPVQFSITSESVKRIEVGVTSEQPLQPLGP